MNRGNNNRQKLARLESVLDTFGADPSRWPAFERRSLDALVEKDIDARRLLGEARAVARLMDAAPAADAGSALKSRIVAAAIAGSDRDIRVVPIEAARARNVRGMSVRQKGTVWPAVALAASFAFGLYLGVAGVGGTTLDGALDIAMSGIPGSASESISWLEEGAAVDEDGPL